MSRSSKIIFVLAIFFHGTISSQTFNKLTPRAKTVIDSTYKALIKKYKVVGASLAIIDNGEIIYAAGYGFADRDKQIKATDKTIYRIGSCTKSFTSLSIMQLNEKKKIDITHSVKEYLPELKISGRFDDNNQIYINDMLCHVSGLPCDVMNGFFCDAPPNMDWLINELNKQTTMSPRRYKHAYSNVAYGLLGEVVARAGKTTYSNYVKENIFKPLEMTSSYIENDSILSQNFSKGYFKGKETKEPLIRDQAAGLIHSNVLDMSNYLQMYLNDGTFKNKTLLSENSVKDMEANHMKDVLLSSTENWGYGLYSEKLIIKSGKDSSVVTMTGHGGDTYVYHSDFAFIPELKIGAVILTNSENSSIIRNASRLLKIYVREVKGKKLKSLGKSLNDSTALKLAETDCTPEDIIGSYNVGDMIVNVKPVKKIKFKQENATIVLKQKKSEPNHYTMTAVLFKIIHVKAKGQELAFVKINGDVYVKSVNTKNNDVEYIAVKAKNNGVSEAWKSRLGNYKLVGTSYKCVNCFYGVTEGMTLKLSEKSGFLVLKTKGKTSDLNNKFYSNVISDKLAITGGIGRGTGETVSVLDNGNIYYSGYEFQKVK